MDQTRRKVLAGIAAVPVVATLPALGAALPAPETAEGPWVTACVFGAVHWFAEPATTSGYQPIVLKIFDGRDWLRYESPEGQAVVMELMQMGPPPEA